MYRNPGLVKLESLYSLWEDGDAEDRFFTFELADIVDPIC